jgi:hypothetical protein
MTKETGIEYNISMEQERYPIERDHKWSMKRFTGATGSPCGSFLVLQKPLIIVFILPAVTSPGSA